MQEVYRTIARLSTADLTVMINGETGTGKENSWPAPCTITAAARRPVRRRQLAAIPRELIESELFGHERGAFTGATTRTGRFEQADGGTLFLDEIGDMPPEAQTRLLPRVLQEGEFTSVGGRQPIQVNVRIIAATHRDLRTAIRQSAFREDLFYRLNVVPVRLPPLRERAEDIPVLARHFLEKAHDDGLPMKSLDQGAVDRLAVQLAGQRARVGEPDAPPGGAVPGRTPSTPRRSRRNWPRPSRHRPTRRPVRASPDRSRWRRRWNGTLVLSLPRTAKGLAPPTCTIKSLRKWSVR